MEYVPRITDFCIFMYVFGCKLSLFRSCGSDFGITPVDDVTIGITWAAFCFHIARISFASIYYYHYYYYYYYYYYYCHFLCFRRCRQVDCDLRNLHS